MKDNAVAPKSSALSDTEREARRLAAEIVKRELKAIQEGEKKRREQAPPKV